MRHGHASSSVVLGLLLALLVPGAASARELSFAERVSCHEAIERVRFSHQIGAIGSFETAVPHELLESRVRASLEQSAALEQFWNSPLTSLDLEDELRRIAGHTQMPERLLEVYQTLDHDAFLIQECFVRPLLVERRIRGLFAADVRIHTAARQQAEVLQRRLGRGQIDLSADFPGRMVLESPVAAIELAPLAETLGQGGGVGPVMERPDAFAIPVRSFATGQASWYTIDKETFESWWKRNREALAQPAVESVASPDASLERIPDSPRDTWTPMSTTGTPGARRLQAMVWTGNQVLVWGGVNDFVNPPILRSGGAYDPVSDAWKPLSILNAPSAHAGPSAVWTGSEMLVWGGYPPNSPGGGRYNPITDSWNAISHDQEPVGRYDQSAVWTGRKWIVWGGMDNHLQYHNTGAVYDPLNDTWSPTSLDGAPDYRSRHAAVWTGSRMVVWGGSDFAGRLDTGGAYDPLTDTWTPTTTTGAPEARTEVAGVWTGRQMVILFGNVLWGGLTYTGGRYDPESDSWSPTAFAPLSLLANTTVWTGRELLTWGGIQYGGTPGVRYDPLRNTWAYIPSQGAPIGRLHHAAVWTGNSMIVWGGYRDLPGPPYIELLDSGGVFHAGRSALPGVRPILPFEPYLGTRIGSGLPQRGELPSGTRGCR